MIEKNKENQTQSLGELQQELKSLKALLLSRGPSFATPSPSPVPSFVGRPSIPSWQLAGSSQSEFGSTTGATAGPSTPSISSLPASISTEKEPESSSSTTVTTP